MLDFRRSTMRPAARLVPLPLHGLARVAQTALRTRGLTPADVVNSSFPKSGSTWLRFVVADLALADLAAEDTEVDFTNVMDLSPPLGAHSSAPRLIDGRGRFIKTHESHRAFVRFPFRGLYIVRDGRDVAVSLYHFLRRWNLYDGPFGDYLTAFLHGRVVNYGTWHDHVASWYRAAERRPEAIAVVRYEDLLGAGGASALQAALARIGWSVPVEGVERALERNSFERMKKMEAQTGVKAAHRASNATPSLPFVRQGRAGQWRETFSDAELRRFSEVAGEALRVAGYEVAS